MSADGTRELSLFVRTLKVPLDAEAKAADLIYKTLQLLMKDRSNRDISNALAQAIKHKDATMLEVNNFAEAKALMKKFEENGIYYSAQASLQVNGKDTVVVVVMNQDLQQAKSVMENFYAERFGGLCSNTFLEEYADGKLKSIKGLSEEEANLFIMRCKEQHIPVGVEGPENGKFRLLFAEKDMEKMSRIQADTAVSMEGPAKELYRRQLSWTNHYNIAAMNAVISGKYPDGSTVQEGSALVGSEGKSVEITRQYIKLYQGDTVRRLSRNATGDDLKRNIAEISQFVKGMERSVFLDRRDYQTFRNLPTVERGDYLIDCQRLGLLLPREIYKANLTRNAMNDRMPDGGRFRSGDMVVDVQGTSIEVRDKDIVIKTPGSKPQTYPRRSDEARAAVEQTIQTMSTPVYLEAAKAKELSDLETSEREQYIAWQEKEARTFVSERHILTPDEMRAVAQAEAMRHTIEVRLQSEGIELPKTDTMTYSDAANVFGLKGVETQEFSSIMETGVTAQVNETEMEDVIDRIMDRFTDYEPQAAQISDLERWDEESQHDTDLTQDIGLDQVERSDGFGAELDDLDDAMS